MIYRIKFEAVGGFWCVEFQCWQFFWRPVRRLISGPGDPVAEVLQFDTYEDAESWVKERGIDRAYYRAPTKGYLSAVQSGAINFNVPQGWRLVQES